MLERELALNTLRSERAPWFQNWLLHIIRATMYAKMEESSIVAPVL